MSFETVAIYMMSGDFVGFGILNPAERADSDGVVKLQSANVYVEGQEDKLNKQLELLNQNVDLRAFWPNPKDPEVLALLEDRSFIPIEYEQREMVDDDNSHYVWKQEIASDEHGNYIYDPGGHPQMVQGSEL